MPREIKKIKNIVSELLDYFLNENINDINVRVQLFEQETQITLTAQTTQLPENIDTIIHKINTTRHPEVEDYYDDLLGIRDNQLDLEVLATVVDSAKVQFENNIMTFTVIRKIK